ncbi:carboxylating nicotinate-nucleotide diphosphorylase [Methylonatrum kenyense]|uniref:carboxylating nicotinate-nucleotide diphosphorylase n=1 Tax=Methylonatrum kenyense TaxID=455253 RepID=UPI0020BE7A6B|nr:carboxylating nicotinate-nucleotide diphosphorylase [Methylonatrum kenyense]MCK8517106.1 carboxylating nicotinate-nucleotide diphosphorylase [Methylonatrum kenyense]
MSKPGARTEPALPPLAQIEGEVRRALQEDIGPGDLTAELIPADRQMAASVITREAAVLCGTAWFDTVFRVLDPAVEITWQAGDGDRISADQLLCTLNGPARAILTGERTALNFLQTLSGTATAARQYVDAVAGTGVQILDTRKTIPGLRLAQKYAAACGGCRNHRIGLFDAILIKENHIAAAGSITSAVEAARKHHPGVHVEVETEDLAELREALAAGADSVMLDDYSLTDMKKARQSAGPDHPLEASGSVSLETIRTVAETGVSYISVGAITKHLRAVDLSMRHGKVKYSQ